MSVKGDGQEDKIWQKIDTNVINKDWIIDLKPLPRHPLNTPDYILKRLLIFAYRNCARLNTTSSE